MTELDPALDDLGDTDEFAAEAQNVGECDAPHLHWHDCPMLPRRDMLAIIAKCKGTALSGEAVNLLGNALTHKPRSDLLTHYIGPNLYHPGSHYIYTTPDPSRYRYKNWRPELTAAAIEHQSIAACGLFSNPLAWIDEAFPKRAFVGEGEADLPPGERTYNAGFTVYTIEFDGMPLNEQLRIIYSGKLKRIDAELRRYRDYRGYEIVYSGGKSLHFHFCFDLRHLKRELAAAANSSYRDTWTRDLPDCLLRPSYEICWKRLAAAFCEIAEVDYNPDPALNSWEQLRRCPWALRLVSSVHPLGLPTGYLIGQPVLASGIFRNAKRGATEWFHEPLSLLELRASEQMRRPRKTFARPEIAVTSREAELFDRHAGAAFSDIIGAAYPKFAWWEDSKSGFKCYFRNGPNDMKPSSFCEGNRSRIVLQGQHGFDSDGMMLTATPNQIFDWIVSQHRVEGGLPADDWIMRRYKATVHDRDSLARFLDDHIVEMVAPPVTNSVPAWILRQFGQRDNPNTHVLIRGPQGCGKSTKMMSKIPAIYDNDPGIIYFSSPSIAQAMEKVETFERVNRDERFVPYLYLSVTALYEKYCGAGDRITQLSVLEAGGSSWLHAVHERQPEVFAEMFANRCRLLEIRDEGQIPVLFGTHETMRQHAGGSGMTRIFYARDFCDGWFEPLPRDERDQWKRHLLRQNDFHRVIVDEVTAHDLVSIHERETVEWVQRCAEQIELDPVEPVAEQYSSFTDYLFDNPCRDVTWNLFLDVLKCDYGEDHLVEVSGREVPFDDIEGIYAKMVGQPYYVRPRGWWNAFWRVTMLTTEAVPTGIIEAIDREAAGRSEEQDDRFKLYEFDLPASSRDIVTMELQRACRKETLAGLVRAYHVQYPDAEIISDMVKTRISEFSITTHMSAKGSNAYISSDIIAFYNALSPALFGELGALNARFGRSDLVRLFYVDRFDQTSGRNRGFRGRQGCDHIAVFPPRLNSWLAPAMSSASYVRVHAKPTVELKVQVDRTNECAVDV